MKADCDHPSTLSISAKCSDRCHTTFPDGAEQTGYVPCIPGIGGGDYIELSICMNCHCVVGFQAEAVRALMSDAAAQTQDLEESTE